MDVFVWLTVFVLIWAIITALIVFTVRAFRGCKTAPQPTTPKGD